MILKPVDSARLDRLKRRRALWLQIHLWMGLVAGFLLSIAGITGSISVFYQELDEWLNPGVLSIVPDLRGEAAYKPLQQVLEAAASATQPDDHRTSIQAPRTAGSTYGVGYIRSENKITGTPETWVSVRVNPYTAEVAGIRTFPLGAGLPPGLIDFIAVLHYRLLLSDFWGGSIVGFVGLVGLLSLLTGIILWWPLTGNWRQALTFKRSTNSRRVHFDIHKLTGIYLLIVLAPVLLSGVYMNFNSQFVGLVRAISPGTNQQPQAHYLPGDRVLGLAKAADIAARNYPEGQLNWVADNVSDRGVYIVSRREVASTSHFWAERIITVEAATGKIIHVRDATTRQTAGETFLDWQWPLHSGKAFGLSGRILVFLSGLALPVLFFTGVIRWLQKKRVKNSLMLKSKQIG